MVTVSDDQTGSADDDLTIVRDVVCQAFRPAKCTQSEKACLRLYVRRRRQDGNEHECERYDMWAVNRHERSSLPD